MHNGDFPDPLPSDRLGRMLVISMVFHVALFGGLVWYNSRTPRLKPLIPTYTVDLVNMPLPAPAPGPKTDAPHETPSPGPSAPPMTEAGKNRATRRNRYLNPKALRPKNCRPSRKNLLSR